MKWSILLSAGIILSAPGARAQQPDTALLFLHYKFSHVRDTSDRANPYKEDMVLAIGKNASVYRSYDRQRWIAQTKKEYRTAAAAAAGGPIMFNIHVAGTGSEYFQFPNTGQLVRKEELFGSFLVTDPLPVIAWQVTGDTATFGRLHCQKATGHFKGRDYIAWFCPDLPLHTGPWELGGLPGVIVEAYDTKRDVQFLFDGIEKAAAIANDSDQSGPPPMPGIDFNGDPDLISLPENATKTTDKEFAKLQAAYKKDPNAFAQSAMAAHNGGMAGDNGPRMSVDIKARPAGPVINNPIELPEKP
ncbi:GLPGLI family protein [Dinghuibacter silviterrae]|uniref:GLPGLI family protein n=1 Tax=Dinghuibacter silviterrae TaxID=1539049 RepID=A0A4R8DM49_9BACT|nr:GLPGLI family protein [Dinghuibacter silviterrae]TDW99049.1 GLPGLI family protein [Dinghuibacter silviterrae]